MDVLYNKLSSALAGLYLNLNKIVRMILDDIIHSLVVSEERIDIVSALKEKCGNEQFNVFPKTNHLILRPYKRFLSLMIAPLLLSRVSSPITVFRKPSTITKKPPVLMRGASFFYVTKEVF